MDTKSLHLQHQPAPECILKGVGPKGEFHENACSGAETTRPASKALLTGVVPTDEIHLAKRCASEGTLKGVVPKGEFHEIAESASEILLAGVALTGEIHLEKQCASEGIVEGVMSRGGYKVVPPQRTTCPRRPSEGGQLER